MKGLPYKGLAISGSIVKCARGVLIYRCNVGNVDMFVLGFLEKVPMKLVLLPAKPQAVTRSLVSIARIGTGLGER
jgi:hypothetical protein